MSERLTPFPDCQERLRRQIRREFEDRYNKAEDQKQLKEVTEQYLLAMASIGIGPDDMEGHGLVVPQAANANPRPASLPPSRKLRRAGVLMAVAGGFFALSWVYLLIAITSLVTYYPRRAYYRLMGK